MSGLEDWRSTPRKKISGRAYWSGKRFEGACALGDLSLGGASIVRSKCPLPEGEDLLVALELEGCTIEGVAARIVRTGARDLALEFRSLTDEQRAAIESVLIDAD